MNCNFQAGDKVISIVDAYPINLKHPTDVQICTLKKGDILVVKKVHYPKNNTYIIEVEVNKSQELFKPLYWASYFQLVDEAKEVIVYYKF